MLPCDDWFYDPPAPGAPIHAFAELRQDVVPIVNGLDRLWDGRLGDANDPAIFEVAVPADPARELVALVLEAHKVYY